MTIRFLFRMMRRLTYRRVYLHSRHWIAFRSSWWARHPTATCAVCHRGWKPMDLHHLSYARIGHELDSDVKPVHRFCHDVIHRRNNPARKEVNK